MRTTARTYTIAMCLLFCESVAAQTPAAPVGTLFFSPAERAQIGAGRGQTPVASPAGVSAPVLTYQGVVRRSSGKNTVWVNGQALAPGDEKTPPLRDLDAVLAGQPLRVGQSVQTVSGQRQDVTADGAVTVRRAP